MLADNLTTQDLVVLTVHGVFAVFLLVGTCRTFARDRLLQQAVFALRAIKDAILPRVCEDDDDDLAAEVERRTQAGKVNNLRKFCQLFGFLSLLTTLNHIYLIAMGQVPEDLTREACTFVLKALTGSTLLFPTTVSSRSLAMVYILMGITVAATVGFPAYTGNVDIALSLMANTTMMGMSVLMHDLHVVAPVNALFVLAACSSILANNDNPCFKSAGFLVLMQIAAFLAITAFSHVLGEWSRATIREGLQMKAAKQLLAAATALLRSSNDMVIELDSDGAIVGHALDLGGFLLRGPSYSLQGHSFTQLMLREEDRQRFAAGLRAHRDEYKSTAEAIKVHMRDAIGTVLDLQLLVFPFAHADETSRYMVGIRGNFPAPGGSCPERRGPDAAGREGPPPRGLPSADGTESVGTGGEDVLRQLSDGLPATVVVDMREGGFPVQEVSTGFRTRVGRISRGTRLRDLMRHGDQFESWIIRTMNCIGHGDSVPAPLKCTLYMPQGQVTAKCKVLKIDSWYNEAPGVNGEAAPGGGEGAAASEEPPPILTFRRVELLFAVVSLRMDSSIQPRWQLPLPSTSMSL